MAVNNDNMSTISSLSQHNACLRVVGHCFLWTVVSILCNYLFNNALCILWAGIKWSFLSSVIWILLIADSLYLVSRD